MASVKGIIDTLSNNVQKLGHLSTEARHALLAGARSLIAELETPNEYVVRTTWSEPARNICVRMAIEKGLFAHLASQSGGVSSSELAKATNNDEDLTRRIMRHLAAMDIVTEVQADTFAATKLSRAFTSPGHEGGMIVGVDLLSRGYQAMPDHIAASGNKFSTELTDTAFNKAFKVDGSVYDFFAATPPYGHHFMMFMTGYREGTPKWYNPGFYPVMERLPDASLKDKDAVLIVDAAGGIGTDIMEFFQEHGSSLPGRFVLQDVPYVIEVAKASGKLDPRVECMEFDLFKPQPVKGARVYHMHSIMHNWPDKQCHMILENIVPAMKKGYSKILIFDNAIPEKGARWTQTGEDVLMSMIFSAGERTVPQWTALLAPHGLKINGIWSVPGGEESAIEAELA